MPTHESTLNDIGCRIVESERSERARIAGRLEDIGEFDARDGARQWGYSTTSDWLATNCGMDKHTAREHVRVARRLRQWPAIAEALALRQLSYSQVREITRAQETEEEAELLRVARGCTVRQIELYVQQLRSSRSADLDAANRGRAKRYFKYVIDEVGSAHIFGRLPAEQAAAVIEAIETRTAELAGDPDDPARPFDWTRAPLAARRADALYELVTGGGATTEIVLHADLEALACRAEGEEPRAGNVLFLRNGPAIPSELGRRLACDCKLSSNDLNYGRAIRVVTPQQRRYVERRDGRICSFPGCDRTHGLDMHHIIHWIDGGTSDPENYTQFCPAHHYLHHEGRFTCWRRGDGSLAFADHHGREIGAFPDRAPPQFAVAG